MNHHNLNPVTYPSLKAAVEAVCQRWCEENGYCDPFCLLGEWWAYPNQGVIPVKVRDVIDLSQTKAQRVRIRYCSIALLPDGSLAPQNHPELD